VELFFRLYFFGINGGPFKIQNWVVQGLWDIGRSSLKLDYKLGWSPKTNWDEGIEKTIAAYLDNK